MPKVVLQVSKIKLSSNSTGQIRFHKITAALIAMEQFIKKFKKYGKFIRVLQKEEKPTGAKGLLKLITEMKQNPPGIHKVCTTNVPQAYKIFNESLLKEGKLSCIKHNGCFFYIPKTLERKYDALKAPGEEWPMVSLDERSAEEFYKSMNTYGVDLSDILLSAERELISQDDSEPAESKSGFVESNQEDISEQIERLKSLDIDSLGDDEVSYYIKYSKSFLERTKLKLGKNKSMLKEIDLLIEELKGIAE